MATPAVTHPHVRQIATVRLAAHDAATLSFTKRGWLVPAGSNSLTRVLLVSPGTKRVRTVARTAFSRGLVNWSVGFGDWIAWVDQSREQSDQDGDVLWRVWAKNVRTGKKRLLSSNRQDPDPYVPVVYAGHGSFVWATSESDRSVRQWVWTPSGGSRTLLRHADLSPFAESVSGRQLVYLGPPAVPRTRDTVGGDCWSLPLSGKGEPRPVTRTGLAMDCRAAAGRLVFFEHIAPSFRPRPSDGLLDDPWEVRTKPLGKSGTGRLESRRYIEGASPAVGQGFAAWLSQSGRRPVVVQGYAKSSRPTGIVASSSASTLGAHGHTLVYSEQGSSGRGRVVLHFFRVTSD